MIEVAQSRHVRTANELMLIVPVKAGFVDGADRLVSYATRLTWILSALAEDLRQAAEETLVGNASRIERLNTIFNTQWAVRERAAGAELLVSAVFDRSWEDYFHLLVDRTGPMLDLIFCHCEGAEGRTCRDGYEAFADFIRSHQVQTQFFHTELRDLTVDDLRIVRHFGDTSPAHGPLPSLQEQAEASLQRAVARRGAAAVTQDLQLRAANAVTTLFELRSYFPGLVENKGSPTALAQYDLAAVQLLEPQRKLLADPSLPIPDAARAWAMKLQELGASPASSRQRVELSRADLDNIQGNVLLPYEGVLEGDILLVQCETPQQRARLLEHFAKVVHSQAAELAGTSAMRVNVAVTYCGLARIGLDASMLAALPLEFRQGMESRSAIIGDVGEPNHPQYWQRPKLAGGATAAAIDLGSVDFVVTLQGGDAAARSTEIDVLQGLGAVVLHQQQLRRKQRDGQMVDAFGFLDPGNANTGSQPVANATLMGRDLTRPANAADVVELGELVLGYPDARGDVARCADSHRDAACAEIFRQGSFVVLRKLEQHVAAMKAFLASNAEDPRAVDDVLGRDRLGKPLADRDAPNNDFSYDADPKGRRCPLHAHIRLSNPRNANDEQRVPRIMRRGFSYKNSEDDQGLMFMAYGANIASQFEVIQRWLNGGNSTGIFSRHNDVISGTPLWDGALQPGAWKAPPQRLVSLRWGMYLFVPARAALRRLAQLALTPSAAAGRASEQGRQMLTELEALQDPTRAMTAWKQLLETEESRARAAQVWSVIRSERKPRRTPYGWLVGDVDNARAVLSDDGRNFSVREYWSRLSDTIGEHYLGLDDHAGKLAGSRCPRDARFEQRQEQVSHERAGERANRYLYEQLHAEQAFDKALFLSYSVLAEQKGQVDIRAFVALIVGLLAKEWIGVPAQQPQELIEYMKWFTVISRFSFQPYPDETLRRQALGAGALLRKGYAKDELTDPMSTFMREQRVGSQPSDDAIRVARMGAIVGFAPPTIANLISVILRWRANGELMRQAQLARQRVDAASKRQGIQQPLLAALRDAPVPPTLYRTLVTPWKWSDGEAQPGELVVVSLQSTWIDAELRGYSEPWQWLFGGAHAAGSGGAAGSLHGCPGRLPALAAMCGIMAALADCGSFQWIGPYLLRVDASQLSQLLAAAQSARYRGAGNGGRRQRSSTVPPPS
jgi:deferrochelatase/peroxidase EfeB